MLQIADGVYQLRVPMPGNAVMSSDRAYTLVYLVDDPGGWVLIDAGWNYDEGWQTLQAQVSDILPSLRDIRTLVVTHFHPDHLGLAARVKEASGARLVMHRNDAPGARQDSTRTTGSNPLNRSREWLIRCGASPEETNRAQQPPGGGGGNRPGNNLSADHVVDERSPLLPGSDSLYTLWTPGHSPGHLCVYDSKRKLLFSGDHVLPTISPNIGLFPFSNADPLLDYQDSLRRVKELEVGQVLPAHEKEFTDLPGRVDELLEHHQERLHEVIAAAQGEPRTGFQIAALLTWHAAPWPQMQGFTRFLALGETMSHLRHLVNQGKIREDERDGIAYYQTA